jgi:hypothetical protein
MKMRRILMVMALSLMTVLVVFLILRFTGGGRVGQAHTIGLRGGHSIEGALVELQESVYLVQTSDQCIILPREEIREIDGEPIALAEPQMVSRVPTLFKTFEDLSPHGEIEFHATDDYQNPGPGILCRVDWGLGPHELWQLETYQVFDEFGNPIPLRVEEDPKISGKRIHIELPRPVLPGETLRLTSIYRQQDGVMRDGETWIYRHRGDYPDDRLVTRTVRLPAGAEILSVAPEPLHQLASGGRKLVVWRRYFFKGEIIPWEIRYKLSPSHLGQIPPDQPVNDG